jgi:uncharacterized membrane protein
MSMNPNAREGVTPAPSLTSRWLRFRSFVRSKLTWGRLYRVTSYLKSALWTVPLVAIALELVLAPVIHALDAWQRWSLAGLAPAGATALYQTVITLTLSFLVFTFSSLLVAIQVAGGQLTPRIIATTLLRNNVVRYSVGLFVFSLVFAVGALNRQEETVHELVAVVTAMALLLGMIGGLGLTGTMTMNVVERSREIGIIRAIGATDAAVRRIFVAEGVVIGVIAWAIGAVLSLPLSKVFSDMLGDVFVQRPLSFSPSIPGLGLWLGIVIVLSVLGSLVPAWRASRIAVREVLGYE